MTNQTVFESPQEFIDYYAKKGEDWQVVEQWIRTKETKPYRVKMAQVWEGDNEPEALNLVWDTKLDFYTAKPAY